MITACTNDAFIPVYVINLRDSVSRREHMEREMAKSGIPFTFIEAISSSEVTGTIGAVSKSETACALSHLHALRLIAEGKDDFAAIFEDDVLVSPDAKLFLNDRALRALPRFDIMQLCNLMKRPGLMMTVATLPGGHRICAGPRPSVGTQALIYHRSAAQRIVREITEISAAIDQMLFVRMDVFGLRIVSVRPSVVQHMDFQTTINPAPGLKFRNKALREFNRAMNCLRRAAAWIKAFGATSRA